MKPAPVHTERPSDGAEIVAARAPEISDGALVRRARAGDGWAEDVLLRRHSPGVHALLVRLLADSADAEDALQDTLILAVRDLRSLNDPDAFGGWIRRIAVHRAHRRFRRRRLSSWLGRRDEAGLEGLADPGASPEARAELALLDRTLARMSAALRTAWMLRHVEGHRLEEVAELTGVSLATSKRRLARAERIVRAHANRGAP